MQFDFKELRLHLCEIEVQSTKKTTGYSYKLN